MSLDNFFSTIDYEKAKSYQVYWNSIKPKDNSESFKRWLFALCSIRTTWKQNVRGYQALSKDLSWMLDPAVLQKTVENTKIGLTKVRVKALWGISRHYINDQDIFIKNNESWPTYRDRLATRLYGIGKAKTAFAIEMLYPLEAEVSCLDIHMLKALSWNKTSQPSNKDYDLLEQDWISRCKAVNVPSPIARHMYWDTLHKQKDSRYWSFCLESSSDVSLINIPPV